MEEVTNFHAENIGEASATRKRDAKEPSLTPIHTTNSNSQPAIRFSVQRLSPPLPPLFSMPACLPAFSSNNSSNPPSSIPPQTFSSSFTAARSFLVRLQQQPQIF
jgi:hypothetical protein